MVIKEMLRVDGLKPHWSTGQFRVAAGLWKFGTTIRSPDRSVELLEHMMIE